MATTKNNKKGKCPFRNLKPCSEECAFYRKGMRYSESGSDPIPFENRTFMMQKEVGETKNIMAFKILSDLGMVDKKEAAQRAAKLIDIPEDKKLIK